MIFANPTYLYALLAIPLLIVLFLWRTWRRQRQLDQFGERQLVDALMPDRSRIRPVMKFTLQLLALSSLIVACARPQYAGEEETNRTSIEVMVAQDVSNSMLAQDVKPNRLERSKQLLSRVFDDLQNDRVGLVVFAGDAFVQMPITSDKVSAKMFLDGLSPQSVQRQGTAIGAALEMAVNGFSQDKDRNRAILLVTDGENFEDDAVEMAQKIGREGIEIIVVGIGGTEGAPIPDPDGGYHKDRNGQTVMTQLNEQMCQQIAEAAGGVYIHADDSNAAQRMLDSEIDKLGRRRVNGVIYNEYSEQFQSFLLLALLLLLLDYCLFPRQNHWIERLHLFHRNRAVAVGLLLLIAGFTQAQQESPLIRKGNQAYKAGNYQEAEQQYRAALKVNPKSYVATYNLGNALFKQSKPQDALKAYDQAKGMLGKEDNERRARVYHNMGNCYYGQQQWQQAVDCYKQSLKAQPQDNDTRYNLVKALEKLKQQQQKNQPKPKPQPQQQPDQDAAQQMLDAMEQQEKQTQDKVKHQMPKQQSRAEKDW